VGIGLEPLVVGVLANQRHELHDVLIERSPKEIRLQIENSLDVYDTDILRTSSRFAG
jgi:hypothetical protein